MSTAGFSLPSEWKELSCPQEVKWEEAPAKNGPNGYMELLIKETVTLHKVLSKYLPVNAVEVRICLTYGFNDCR